MQKLYSFLEKFPKESRLGVTVQDALRKYCEYDGEISDFARAILKNELYVELFSQFLDLDSKTILVADLKKSWESFRQQVGILGFMESRNLLLSLRFHKLLHGNLPIDKDGFLEIKPKTFMKFSSELEELFARNNLRFGEIVFSAALSFDFLLKKYEFDKSSGPHLEVVRTICLLAKRSVIIANCLSNRELGVPPRALLLAAAYLHLGKIEMLHAFQEDSKSYLEFFKNIVLKGRWSSLTVRTLELEKFDVCYEEFSTYHAMVNGIIEDAHRGIEYCREPYLISSGTPVDRRMAEVLGVIEMISLQWKVPSGVKDPIFELWNLPLKLNDDTDRELVIQQIKTALSVS